MNPTFSHGTGTACNAPTDVAPGSYTVTEPAPGVAEPVPPVGNGTWYIGQVLGEMDGVVLTTMVSTPAYGPFLGAVAGRGLTGVAEVPVQRGKLSKVTFTNIR